MKTIYPFETTWTDYPDNYSQAILIYTVGCEHNCASCQNPDLQNKNHFNDVVNFCSWQELNRQIRNFSLKHKTRKVIFSGGDPLFYNNINTLREFLDNQTDFDVTIYTGYNIKVVKEKNIKNFKFIKCGKFQPDLRQQSEKTDSYISFASTNQKLYNSNYKLLSTDGIYYF